MRNGPIISTPRDGLASLTRLSGTWQLQREIRHGNGQVDRFKGFCAFVRSGPRLIQDERGTLDTAHGSFEATRRYVWTRSDGWLHIHFADMRPFVSIPLGVPSPEAIHLCDPDRYEVRFDFSLWPEWQSTWTVTGPRKDYVMTTRFSPG